MLLGSDATGHLPIGDSPRASIVLPAPTLLYITTPTVSSLTMNWTAPVGGGTPTSYTIEYSLHGEDDWTVVTGVAGSPYVVTGLVANTEYDFAVEAVYAGGSSGFSALASGTTLATPIAVFDLIPVFPSVPEGFPVKMAPNMDTVIGTTKSLRELRKPQRTVPLWDFELPFEELRDQTQNQVPFAPLAGFQQFEQLAELFLMMYGQEGNFAFNAPWDNSRSNQFIGTGDGVTTTFTCIRTWGYGDVTFTEPVGLVNVVTAVYLNGSELTSPFWSLNRNKIIFNTAPDVGVVITMTYSYYYVCKFTEDEQNFEEFMKNRWTVPSLKFQSIYWP